VESQNNYSLIQLFVYLSGLAETCSNKF